MSPDPWSRQHQPRRGEQQEIARPQRKKSSPCSELNEHHLCRSLHITAGSAAAVVARVSSCRTTREAHHISTTSMSSGCGGGFTHSPVSLVHLYSRFILSFCRQLTNKAPGIKAISSRPILSPVGEGCLPRELVQKLEEPICMSHFPRGSNRANQAGSRRSSIDSSSCCSW